MVVKKKKAKRKVAKKKTVKRKATKKRSCKRCGKSAKTGCVCTVVEQQ